jgi:hypothetical protein
MIKFKFESIGHPDFSRIECAYMDKEYTAREFIAEVLKAHPKDHGSICLNDGENRTYRNGKLLQDFVSEDLLDKVVINVTGISSYYNTDYKLFLKGCEQEKNKKKEVSVNELLSLKSKLENDLIYSFEIFENKTGVKIKSVKFDWDNGLDVKLDI